jgi:hypothetical protein
MPYKIFPDGSYKYGDTLDEAQEPFEGSNVQIEQESTVPTGEQEIVKEEKEEEKKPSWVSETLKTLGSMITHLPETVTVGAQKLAQSTPEYVLQGFASGAAGGYSDPNLMLIQKAQREGKPVKEVLEKQLDEAEKGQIAARFNISPPTENGEFYKLGLSKDIPVLGAFSDEGKIYKAFEPETETGEFISDLGQLIVLSSIMPQGSQVFGYGTTTKTAALRAFAKPNKKHLLGLGLKIFKGIGAELPQDFLEELYLFAPPDPTDDQEAEINRILNLNDSEVKSAAIDLLLSDTDAEAEYYANYGENLKGGMAGAFAFRGILASVNNLFRLHKAKKVKNLKLTEADVDKALNKPINDVKVKVEEAQTKGLEEQRENELYEYNSTFNGIYQESLPNLNKKITGLHQGDLAIQKALEEGETAATKATEISGANVKVTDELKRINKLLKARQGSIRDINRAVRNNPEYFNSLTNKRRFNRYTKDLDKYKKRIDELKGESEQRLIDLEEPTSQGRIASAQFDSLQASRAFAVNEFVNELQPLLQKLDSLHTARLKNGVNISTLDDDPFYQSYKNVKQLYDNYVSLGGQNRAAGADLDPGLENTRQALEVKLLNGIQDEFQKLEEYGTVGNLEIDPKALEMAAEEVGQPMPKAKTDTKDAKKGDDSSDDPWYNNTDQMPLKLDEDGKVTIDPDATTTTGTTTQAPLNKEARLRQAQVRLGLGDSYANLQQQKGDAITDLDLDKSLDDYAKKEAFYAMQEQKAIQNGTKVPDSWDRLSLRSLERSVGRFPGYNQRKLALLDAVKNLKGQPDEVTSRFLKRSYQWAGKLANAEAEFEDLYTLLETRRLARGKAMAGVEDAMFETGVLPLQIGVTSSRLYKIMGAIRDQASNLNASELQTYRALAAQEALILYQSVGDFMQLRNLAGSFLASLRGTFMAKIANRFGKAQAKVRQGKKADELFEEFADNANTLTVKLAEDAKDKLPTYIGLDSNAKKVEEILNKFTDPDLTPTDSDLNIFNKITSQLTVAGLNPESLGSIAMTGDRILYTQMISAGLSNISTQTGFLPQTFIYSAAYDLNQLLTGKINAMWNKVPWIADKEALASAVRNERIAKQMLRTKTEVFGEVLGYMYKARQFDRSIITDAAQSIEDAGKFRNSRVKDPFREQEKLDLLGDKSRVQLPDNGLGRAIQKIVPPEKLQQVKNNLFVDLLELHDKFFLGDAYQGLGKSRAGKFAQFMYKTSPSGFVDSALDKLTGGRISPRKSKLTSGERVGGTLPLFASETSTELIGGVHAFAFAKAKARIMVEDMLDGKGVPKFKKGTPEFEAEVERIYRDDMMEPIRVGIGEKAEDVSFAIADEEAMKVALSFDMMMEPGDDIFGKTSKFLQAGGRDEDLQLYKAVLFPYVRAPFNAFQFHLYHSQSFLGTPIPAGAVFEGIGAATNVVRQFQKVLDGKPGSVDLSEKVLGFESKLFNKDPKVRADARSALTLATTFNAGLLALIINGDIEITGGQQTNFREAQAANIPTYSVKILGRWVPYRFLPFIGELLAYGANYRDFARKNTTFMNQNVVGTAIVATAQTFLDAPAIAGLDTLISAMKKPEKAEQLLLQYFEKIGGIRYTALRSGLFRHIVPLVTDIPAYEARPVVSAQRPGIIGKPKEFTYEQVVNEDLTWGEGWADLFDGAKGITELPLRFLQNTARNVGLMPLVEALDEFEIVSDDVKQGDFRQAHWYKEGDITYVSPDQKTLLQGIIGRNFPVPDTADIVDRELFLHGIVPPTQVFRKYGIVANETMVNRFRRFLGTEYRDEGKSVYQMFEEIITNKEPIPGYTGLYYKDLVTTDQNSLTFGGNLADLADKKEIFPTDEITKRTVLMELRSDIISRAAEIYLRGYYETLDDSGNMVKEPIEYAAPQDANEQYFKWWQNKMEI